MQCEGDRWELVVAMTTMMGLLLLLGMAVAFVVLVGTVVAGIVGVAKKAKWGLPVLIAGIVALVLGLALAVALVAASLIVLKRAESRPLRGPAAVSPGARAQLADGAAPEALGMSKTYEDVMNCKTA